MSGGEPTDGLRAFRALAAWQGPLEVIRTRVEGQDDICATVLTTGDVHAVLQRFLRRELDAPISAWARLILMTDGVEYEAAHQEAIADVIFRLATPEIEGDLSDDQAREHMDRLRSS